MSSRPYKIDYIAYPYEHYYAFPGSFAGAAAEPACVDKKDGPFSWMAAGLCQVQKGTADFFIKESEKSAILGTSNAIQTGVGSAGKTATDSVLGTSNAIQDSVLGTSNAIQDWFGDAGYNVQNFFGNMGPWMPVILGVGGLVLLVVLLKR